MEKNTLIVQGNLLLKGSSDAAITIDEWFDLYVMVGADLEGAQARKVVDIAFRLIQKQLEKKQPEPTNAANI
ncbi:MAG: hypothetical protein A2660_01210 [Candidatus Doudnabacteria bacterium RIFCSPHIGHO2_01_FULL_45_18]|uniref:Uncharacterized protein n=1 Tax=Candidatus Doudnabacteria bacterium RIFCSPHIGHO2_01_FULL_45_18 TaxID=1817823 RepID=A0A1F5NS11_9BACT|nr:MAG: hypothetical protein A2660_01210 [Candidatus Doudnabacteria bacterium RIFCSPHIGHO2_01_FULL_45_18]